MIRHAPFSSGRALLLAGLVTATLLAACAEIRVLTYPSDFVYLDDEGVQETMHELARGVGRLDTLIQSDPVTAHDASTLRAIDDELAGLEATLGALGVGAALEVGERDLPRTNHLLIDEHVDEFLTDIARARRMVAADPPNLGPAGAIVGSCDACHRFR